MKPFFVALIVSAFVVVFMAWMTGSIPSQAQYCSEDRQTNQEDCTTANIALVALWQTGKFLDKASAAIAALSSVAIAVFTLTLYRATNKLWESGETQLKQERSSTERQLRAYISVEPAGIEPWGALEVVGHIRIRMLEAYRRRRSKSPSASSIRKLEKTENLKG